MNVKINHLKIFLFLVALHSFSVAVGMIFMPTEYFVEFGYNQITENFFRAQGGIFHLVMAVAYLIAMKDPVKYSIMVLFAISVKFIAFVFLLIYYLFVDSLLVLLLSGIVDLSIALILLYLYNRVEFSDVG